MNRRQTGVRNLYVAKRTSAGVYDTPQAIEGLQEISTTNTYGEYSFYSDNVCDASGKTLTSVDISITLKGLDPKIEAMLMGKEYDPSTGVITSAVNDSAQEVALLYEITTLEGQPSYYRVLYNCKLFREESANTTQGESVESSDVTLTGTAIADENGIVDRVVDGAVSGSSTVVASFFDKVYIPE